MGVKIIPRGNLTVAKDGDTSFHFGHAWTIANFTGYRYNTPGTLAVPAKDFLTTAGKYRYYLPSSYIYRVLLTEVDGMINMRDRDYTVLTSGTLFTSTSTKIGGGNATTYNVFNPMLENASSYDNCVLHFTAGTASSPRVFITYNIYQYGPTN